MKKALIKNGKAWLDPCHDARTFLRSDGWVENDFRWELSETQSLPSDVKMVFLADFLQSLGYLVVLPNSLPTTSADPDRQDRWFFEHDGQLGIIFGEDPDLFQDAKCIGRWNKDQAKRLIPLGQSLDVLQFAYDYGFSFTEEAKDLINGLFEDLDTSRIPSDLLGLLV